MDLDPGPGSAPPEIDPCAPLRERLAAWRAWAVQFRDDYEYLRPLDWATLDSLMSPQHEAAHEGQ